MNTPEESKALDVLYQSGWQLISLTDTAIHAASAEYPLGVKLDSALSTGKAHIIALFLRHVSLPHFPELYRERHGL